MRLASQHYVQRIVDALGDDQDRPLLWWRDTALSAGGLRRMILSAAQAMLDLGVDRDWTVALLTASNSPDLLVGRYAANLLGATVIHLRSTNAASSQDALPVEPQLAMVEETSTRLLVTDAWNHARAMQIRERATNPLVLAAAGDLGPGVHDLHGPVTATASDVARACAAVRPEDLAIITYTSGSTGTPKGICRSFRAWSHAVSTTFAPGERPRMLVTTPLSHTVGPMVDAALTSGGTLVLHEGFDPGRVLRAFAEDRVTQAFLAAPQVYRLLDHPDLPATDTSSLTRLLYGGTPASPTRMAQAVETFGPVLVQTYGTTETWEICGLPGPDHLAFERLGTAGRPSPGIDVELRDPESGEPAPAGGIGEVCVRSPGMLNGYWNDPRLTEKALRDGWFHTGDLGYFDTGGYLHLVDRLAHVIKHSGIKIYPVEVENVLLRHPAVAQAAVFGVRDRDEVEHVHAAVVLVPGRHVTVGDLQEHVRGRLSDLHVPTTLTLRSALPVISSGKLDKQRLKREAAEQLA
ncbi:AMP-binding protein [Actinomadura macrotermitis]|uniref:8-demethylnovobiocic acid synthase n=1 Tax=Actinomadura macrotermitis TaxID=2585200 RepID=A0A7K0BWK5_9ACTN|nr:AMP-binding protein [Actinomadura macrotermitis]MQY05064.1 8-demethylnovobiocic acid synthase [Actinomadura macrotermitis]